MILIVRLLTDISDDISVYALNVEVIKESVPMVVVLLNFQFWSRGYAECTYSHSRQILPVGHLFRYL